MSRIDGRSQKRREGSPNIAYTQRTCKLSMKMSVFFFLAMKLVLNYFDDQLQKQLSQGFKASPEKYLYFDSAWLDGCVSSELTISKY